MWFKNDSGFLQEEEFRMFLLLLNNCKIELFENKMVSFDYY